jgi:hypothetical protein
MTPEGKVKADVKDVLKEYGAWYYMPVQNGMGQTGIPDFVVCLRGQFFGIECKAPGKMGNATANQKRVLEEIRKANGIAFVCDNALLVRTMFEIMGHKPCATSA